MESLGVRMLKRVMRDYSETVVETALRLLESDLIDEDDALGVYWVTGRGGRYRTAVQISHGRYITPDEDSLPYVTCTCANGDAKGGKARCYHSAAAIMLLVQDHPYLGQLALE